MKFGKEELLLYAVTDRRWLDGETLYNQVEQAIAGGVTCVQLREKDLDEAQFLAEAREIQALCRARQVPFIINDDVELTQTIDADGVHVGQKDMTALDVRTKLGPDKIIGVSARTVEQALLAEEQGADYLGVGAVFPTGTKLDASGVTYEMLSAICRAVSIPVVAIGGIDLEKIPKLAQSGIAGVAVVSAIFAQKEITAATNVLRERVEAMLEVKG